MARQGVRIDWSDVPPSFRDEVNQFLGTEVIETTTLDGGFSPGPAVRARLHDGSTVFIKAAGAALNEVTTFMHRREAKVLGALPDSVPAPRLLGVVDDGDWVALVVEWVDGHTPDAADPGDLQRLLSLLERVADVTPATELTGVGSVDRSAFEVLGHWLHLAANPDPGLDDWSRRHLDRLAELDALAPSAAAGTHLLHLDVRTDNVVLAETGPRDDVLVDWPGAALGAPWVDLVTLLPALHLDGGPPPKTVLASSPLGRHADPHAVDAVVAAMAGYFTRMSLLPPPPGLPTVRIFQSRQGSIAREWAAQRLGLW